MIKRTTVVVRDIDASRAFYRDVLGFKIWFDRDFEFSGTGFPGTRKGDRSRLVIAEARDPLIGKIGLLQYLDPPVKVASPDLSFLAPGRIVFVGEVDDIAALHARLQAAGAVINAAPHRFEVVGADGRLKVMTQICFFDPDGNFFELSEPAHSS